MVSLEELQKEIQQIKERNKRVESDKAWETSKTRKIIIAIATYFVIVLFLFVSRIPDPWINALIPSIAFSISTLTIPVLKEFWVKNVYKK